MVSRVFDEFSKFALCERYQLGLFENSAINDLLLLEVPEERVFERIGVPYDNYNLFPRYGTSG